MQQEELARMIQQKCLQWLLKHKDIIYNEELGITYRDLVEDTHEMTFEQYQTLYGHFAGDLVFIEDKKNKNKNKIKIKKQKNILLRIVGVEFLKLKALSNICQLPIVIYSPQKYDEKKKNCYW